MKQRGIKIFLFVFDLLGYSFTCSQTVQYNICSGSFIAAELLAINHLRYIKSNYNGKSINKKHF